MEEEYKRRLEEEMMNLVGSMNDVSPSVFSGEDALMTFLKSVKLTNDGYSFRLLGIEKELLFSILSALKEVGLEPGHKKTSIRVELEEMGLSGFSHYITCKKNGLFDIQIRELNFHMIRKVASILFVW
jgi:hypothetical protein